MFAAKVFNNELCIAHIYENRRILRPSKNAPDDLDPTRLDGRITDDWLEQEINKAYWRDMEDNDFIRDASNYGALQEVTIVHPGVNIIILTGSDEFFGKIRVWRNDAQRTLNAVFIYASGDRRRSNRRRISNYVSSIGIIWFFVAIQARNLYKQFARILIPRPLSPVHKAIVKYGGVFVELNGRSDVNLFDQTTIIGVSQETTLDLDANVKRSLAPDYAGEEEYDVQNMGALFQASSIVQQLD